MSLANFKRSLCYVCEINQLNRLSENEGKAAFISLILFTIVVSFLHAFSMSTCFFLHNKFCFYNVARSIYYYKLLRLANIYLFYILHCAYTFLYIFIWNNYFLIREFRHYFFKEEFFLAWKCCKWQSCKDIFHGNKYLKKNALQHCRNI